MLTTPPSLHDRLMKAVLLLQVVALFVGTLMPGTARYVLERRVDSALSGPSLPLSSLAHLLLFASVAVVLRRRPFNWSVPRIVVATLVLALLSEGLQHFAIDRHPRLVDVGIDMVGTLLGLVIAGLVAVCFARR
ncbi:MAG: VanZ family protein [Pseudomonadota bacterium]